MNPRERNDPVLKTVRAKAHGGSNPSACAKKEPPLAVLLFFALNFSFGCLKAHVHEEPYHIVGSFGKKHRYPMELVHVIGGIYTVRRTKRAEHFGRQFEIYNVDDLVALKAKLAPRYTHYYRIPLAVAFSAMNTCASVDCRTACTND